MFCIEVISTQNFKYLFQMYVVVVQIGTINQYILKKNHDKLLVVSSEHFILQIMESRRRVN